MSHERYFATYVQDLEQVRKLTLDFGHPRWILESFVIRKPSGICIGTQSDHFLTMATSSASETLRKFVKFRGLRA